MLKKITCVLLLLLSASACAGVIQVPQSKPTFSITLQANATTGYHWYLLKYNSKLIQPVSQQYVADKQALKKGVMGAPGKSVWTFKCSNNAFIVPQLTQLKFVYLRAWSVGEKLPKATVYTIVPYKK